MLDAGTTFHNIAEEIGVALDAASDQAGGRRWASVGAPRTATGPAGRLNGLRPVPGNYTPARMSQ